MLNVRLCSSAILLLVISNLALAGGPQVSQGGQAEQHLRRARALESSNDPDAEREYRLAIGARGGRYPRAVRELSWYLQRRLRFSEAASLLEDYISQTPDRDHADDFNELKDLKRAAALQAQIADSEKPVLSDLVEYVNLVSVYGGNKFKDARAYAEKAVSLYPTSSEAYVSLAITMIGSESARRFEVLRKAIELKPDNPEAHRWLGWEYNAGGRLGEAAAAYRKALEVSGGKLVEAWRGLGEVLVSQGKYKEALEAFRNYLKSGRAPRHGEKVIQQKIKELEKVSESRSEKSRG